MVKKAFFCRSLIPRLKRLPNRTRGAIRRQIEQEFSQAEYGSPYHAPQPNKFEQFRPNMNSFSDSMNYLPFSQLKNSDEKFNYTVLCKS